MHICVVLQLCCDSCKCVLVLFRATYNACYVTTFGDEVKVLMAATHGSLSQFDSSLEDWSSYTERLGHYFVANDVDDDRKKRSILLAACGPAAYKLIRSLTEHDSITTTSYADLVKKVKEYYEPEPSAIVQRYKFNTRVRAKGESVATYLAALRELSEYCDYGERLNEILRDRLVCGVNHEGIQKRLLAEKKLTYSKGIRDFSGC